VIPPNVTILFLPPYAPDGEPVAYLRSHFWPNRLYADYDALMDAATTS
jgi:hypothetical protein